MNKLISSLIGGTAGAVALNILHQVVKQFDHDAPRVDLVGEEALSKGLKKVGIDLPSGNTLFTATLAADLLSNAGYFALAGLVKRKQLAIAGAALGLTAGIGALVLTKPIGLSDAPITKTNKTKVMTVAWYTFGGLLAGCVIKALKK
jgi:hypothetical protein